MTLEEASNILHGEQVEVDSAAFATSPVRIEVDCTEDSVGTCMLHHVDHAAEPTGVYLACSVRFPQNKKGGVGGWADIIGETIYVQPTGDGTFGRYVPIGLVRRKAPA